VSRGGRHRPWTDEEVGLVESSHLSASTLAEELGRSPGAVRQMRARLRRGDVPLLRGFTDYELDLMRNTPHLTVNQIAELIGRSYDVTKHRRQRLAREEGIDFGGRGANKSPHRVGKRPLVARTCAGCGLLLDASWFWRNQNGWHTKCASCFVQSEKPADRDRGDGGKRLQALSLPNATRRGQEWTEADMAVLSDEALTVFEKATQTRRTYFGAMSATTRYGFKSKVGRGDPEKGRWVIDNPNEAALAA
jgi:hypothetical protein